ncbi:MAG TPA: hypothetical protein PLB02_09130 [Thermoanaerobaculia bacterium]|nr:hypothetical protein [Thermoanaerobaculia bacterium]
MNVRAVKDAFELFRERVLTRGLTDLTQEEHPKEFGHRLLMASRSGASLRLTWDGKEERLVLEITHGTQTSSWWLDLFSAHCPGGLVPAAPPENPGFAESLDHGLDLLTPERHV